MQFLPASPTETMIREVVYLHPEARCEMRGRLPQPPARGASHG